MSLSVSSYMKQFYRGNLFGATANGRWGRSFNDLVSADVKAVRNALREMKSFDYEDGDGTELWKEVQAYVDTYNNFMDSAKGVGDASLNRYASQLKKLSNEQRDKLADIGVTVLGSGKLKVDKNALMETSRYKVSKVFSKDAEYGAQADKYMAKIKNRIRMQNLDAPKQVIETQESDKTENVPNNAPNNAENADVQAAAADAQLFQMLADALGGSRIDYSV